MSIENRVEQVKQIIYGLFPQLNIDVIDQGDQGTILYGEFSTLIVNVGNTTQADTWMISLNADPSFAAEVAPLMEQAGLAFVGPYCERIDGTGITVDTEAYIERQKHIMAQAVVYAKQHPDEEKSKLIIPKKKKIQLAGAAR